MLKLFVIFYFLQIVTANSSNGTQVNHKYQRFSVTVSSKTKGWGLQMKECSANRCNSTLKFEDNTLSSLPKQQGLVMNIFSQNNGKNIFQKTFIIGEYWAHWADLEWHVKRISPGRIVAMTIAVTGAIGLRNASVTLNHLGSLFASHLTGSSRWTWVFIKGERTVIESVVLGGRADNYAHCEHSLSTDAPFATSQLEIQRWKYCQDYGAMGGLCDTYNPDILPVPDPPKLTINPHVLDNVPIIVTAGKRHQYLYHSLTRLLNAPGVIRNNILIVLGDTSHATVNLLHILNLKYTKLTMKSDVINKNTFGIENLKLFNYYQHVFELVLQKFSKAPATIFLDEDVEISPDFFSYMSQTIWLLQKDKSLYCINGFSQLGLDGMAYNPARLLRGQVQIEWGYAITLEFIKEALELWKANISKDTALYDFWLYRHASNGRECIFPEVSRARHYGVGVNSVADVVENVFLRMKLLTKSQISLQNVTRLQISHWRKDLVHNIKNSIILGGNPCSPDFLPSSATTSVQPISNTKQYSFFYHLDRLSDGYPDVSQYFNTMACFGTWSQSEQGQHEGVTIISPRVNTLLYIIGVPFSSYSYLMPKNVTLWDVDTIDEKVIQFNAKRMALVNHANRQRPKITSTDDMIKILLS